LSSSESDEATGEDVEREEGEGDNGELDDGHVGSSFGAFERQVEDANVGRMVVRKDGVVEVEHLLHGHDVV
jgi:hypothetical protein